MFSIENYLITNNMPYKSGDLKYDGNSPIRSSQFAGEKNLFYLNGSFGSLLVGKLEEAKLLYRELSELITKVEKGE